MMGRRQFIGKLSDLLISGSRAGFSDAPASPVTPLDFKFHQSPRGPKSYDIGGVGLGIVAALEKSSGGILPRRCVCSPGAIRSGRISGHSINMCVRMTGGGGGGGGLDDLEMDCLENYTYVTCHGPNRAFTKVYYDGGLDLRSEHDSLGLDAISEFGGLTESLSSRVRDEEDVPAVFPTLEFLRSCYLCGKNLHGRDIYMYRGEKAFCSSECRSRQIMTDERKEQKCRNEASKAAELSSSPYTKDQIFSTGIIAV